MRVDFSAPYRALFALMGACYAPFEIHSLPLGLKGQNHIGNDRIVSILKR